VLVGGSAAFDGGVSQQVHCSMEARFTTLYLFEAVINLTLSLWLS
jgi:hypothetical protein